MKAVICQNTELQVVDLPEPMPAKGQVLVEVLRCGICGSDLHMRHHCDEFKAVVDKVGFGKVLPSSSDPVVFGHELCAEVLEYGAGCDKKIKPGTRVVAQPVLRVGNAIHLAGLSPLATGGFA